MRLNSSALAAIFFCMLIDPKVHAQNMTLKWRCGTYRVNGYLDCPSLSKNQTCRFRIWKNSLSEEVLQLENPSELYRYFNGNTVETEIDIDQEYFQRPIRVFRMRPVPKRALPDRTKKAIRFLRAHNCQNIPQPASGSVKSATENRKTDK